MSSKKKELRRSVSATEMKKGKNKINQESSTTAAESPKKEKRRKKKEEDEKKKEEKKREKERKKEEKKNKKKEMKTSKESKKEDRKEKKKRKAGSHIAGRPAGNGILRPPPGHESNGGTTIQPLPQKQAQPPQPGFGKINLNPPQPGFGKINLNPPQPKPAPQDNPPSPVSPRGLALSPRPIAVKASTPSSSPLRGSPLLQEPSEMIDTPSQPPQQPQQPQSPRQRPVLAQSQPNLYQHRTLQHPSKTLSQTHPSNQSPQPKPMPTLASPSTQQLPPLSEPARTRGRSSSSADKSGSQLNHNHAPLSAPASPLLSPRGAATMRPGMNTTHNKSASLTGLEGDDIARQLRSEENRAARERRRKLRLSSHELSSSKKVKEKKDKKEDKAAGTPSTPNKKEKKQKKASKKDKKKKGDNSQSMPANPDDPAKPKSFTICLAGQSACGKSALVASFIKPSEPFCEDYDPTIEDSHHLPLDVDGDMYDLEVLDVSGDPSYESFYPKWFSAADGFLAVYNVTDAASLDELTRLRALFLAEKKKDKVPLCLIGTHLDVAEESRQVLSSVARSVSFEWGCPFLETSAVTQTNVRSAFETIVREIRDFGKEKKKLSRTEREELYQKRKREASVYIEAAQKLMTTPATPTTVTSTPSTPSTTPPAASPLVAATTTTPAPEQPVATAPKSVTIVTPTPPSTTTTTPSATTSMSSLPAPIETKMTITKTKTTTITTVTRIVGDGSTPVVSTVTQEEEKISATNSSSNTEDDSSTEKKENGTASTTATADHSDDSSSGDSGSDDDSSSSSEEDDSDSYPEEPPPPMVLDTPGWHIEESQNLVSINPVYFEAPVKKIEHDEHNIVWYKDYFANKKHRNLLGIDPTVGPVVISVMKDEEDQNKKQWKVIYRSKEAVHRRTILQTKLPKFNKAKLLELLDNRLSANHLKQQKKSPDLERELYEFESQTVIGCYKFGVLYQRAGQTTEEEMFANKDGSPKFNNFLQFLGDTVSMKGWTKYSGGLDPKGTTGNKSVYATYESYEVMFHVSTLLPFSEKDTQQLERKRHIGNDVLVFVFQEDEDCIFTPSCISSEFNHIFVVVREETARQSVGRNFYRISIIQQQEVPPYSPNLPDPPVFEAKLPHFRAWLLNKCINGENAAYKAPAFIARAKRTREVVLKRLVEEFSK